MLAHKQEEYVPVEQITAARRLLQPGSAAPASGPGAVGLVMRASSRARSSSAATRSTGSTTDQRLLDSRGPSDWVHTDPWRVLRIQAEFVEGFGALAELGPAIAVFGSARTQPDDPTYAHGRGDRARRSSRPASR